MTVVNGERNSWQCRGSHVIEKVGSHTGGMVVTVALCDSRETAELLIEAMALIKKAYDVNPTRTASYKDFLQRAGIIE